MIIDREMTLGSTAYPGAVRRNERKKREGSEDIHADQDLSYEGIG